MTFDNRHTMSSSRKCVVDSKSESTGSVMIEAALALPAFFLFVFAIFEFSSILREYSSTRAALASAARAFQSVSATQGVTEEQLFQVAGNRFVEELHGFGISTDKATLGKISLSPGNEQNAILTGWTCTLLPSSGYDEPYIYKLVSRLKWQPVVLNLVGVEVDFEVSTLAVFETGGTGTRPTSRADSEVVVYLPDISTATERTKVIEKALLPQAPRDDPFCYVP